MLKFRDLNIKPRYFSGSADIPLQFYEDTFPVSKEIYLFLGYFSSNAIRELSMAFSSFILNDGVIRIITNDTYSKEDHENLILNNGFSENENKFYSIINDYELLEKNLRQYGKHFFDCLKFLKREKRLHIQPVTFKGGNAHTKNMILFDGDDYISTDGSTKISNDGTVTVFDLKETGKYAWNNIETEIALIDVSKVGQVFEFDNRSKEIRDHYDLYDPIKGRILGVADREINIKTT